MWEGIRKEEEEGRTTRANISNYNPTMPKISLFSEHRSDSATGRRGQCCPVTARERIEGEKDKEDNVVRSQFGTMVGTEDRLSRLEIDLEVRDGARAETFRMLK